MEQPAIELQPVVTVEVTNAQPTAQAAERPSIWSPPQEPAGRCLAAEGVYVPQSGHLLAYGPEVGHSYPPQATPRFGRSPRRPRDALNTGFRTEEDGVCTICTEPEGVGNIMVRLICRQMFQHPCWSEAISRGPPPYHERCKTCPKCRGQGSLPCSLELFGHGSDNATGCTRQCSWI